MFPLQWHTVGANTKIGPQGGHRCPEGGTPLHLGIRGAGGADREVTESFQNLVLAWDGGSQDYGSSSRPMRRLQSKQAKNTSVLSQGEGRKWNLRDPGTVSGLSRPVSEGRGSGESHCPQCSGGSAWPTLSSGCAHVAQGQRAVCKVFFHSFIQPTNW